MKTITEMAREAGFAKFLKPESRPEMICGPDEIDRFATLVKAAHVDELLACVEMPEPVCKSTTIESTGEFTNSFYTADQMREFAAAAVLRKDAEIADLKVKVVTLWAERHPVSEVAELKAELAQRDAHIVEYNARIQAEVLKLLGEKDALKAENERLRAGAVSEPVAMSQIETAFKNIWGGETWNAAGQFFVQGVRFAERNATPPAAAMKGQP